MCFQDAIDNCCKCCDDGTAGLKQPFLDMFLDARAVDPRRSLVGAVDFTAESTDENGIKATQVTYPLEYEPYGKPPAKVPEPIRSLAPNGDGKSGPAK